MPLPAAEACYRQVAHPLFADGGRPERGADHVSDDPTSTKMLLAEHTGVVPEAAGRFAAVAAPDAGVA